MDHAANPDIADAVKGALEWWRDAGVDCQFLDELQRWLAQAEPADADDGKLAPAPRKPAPAAPAPASPAIVDPASLPADLAAFAEWWLREPMLGEGGLAGRVAPQGVSGAELMVVVEEPEGDDRERLLSGPQGRLLDAVLAAFGTRREAVYLASALPCHTPGADWAALVQRGFGDVLAHHIHLVSPRRLMVLGGNVLPLIGHESPQRPAALRQFNQQGRSIPLLASWGLPSLMRQPRAKAALWRAWLEWTAA